MYSQEGDYQNDGGDYSGSDQEDEVMQDNGSGKGGGGGGGSGSFTNFFPERKHPEWSTGNARVLGLLLLPGVEGSVRHPCGAIPLSCMRVSLSAPCQALQQWFNFFRSWSWSKSATIYKPISQGSGEISLATITGRVWEEVVVVFLYKANPCDIGLDDGSGSWDGSGSGSGGSWSGSGGSGSGSLTPDDVSSGGGRGRCRRKRQCLCFPRCHGCSFDRSRTRFSDWSGDEWGLVQQETIYILKNVIFKGSNQYFGTKCQDKLASCSTGQCVGTGTGPLPGAGEGDLTQGGYVGNGWGVRKSGINFPEPPSSHGFPSIGNEEILMFWTAGTFMYRVRNPITRCIFTSEVTTLVW